MTKYFALTLNTPVISVKPKTKKIFTRWHVKNPAIFVIIGFFVLGILYLAQVNSLSTKGYEIKKLEQQIVGLKEINERLELESRTLKSVEMIKSEAKYLNLVPSSKVNFVPGNSYAFQQ